MREAVLTMLVPHAVRRREYPLKVARAILTPVAIVSHKIRTAVRMEGHPTAKHDYLQSLKLPIPCLCEAIGSRPVRFHFCASGSGRSEKTAACSDPTTVGAT